MEIPIPPGSDNVPGLAEAFGKARMPEARSLIGVPVGSFTGNYCSLDTYKDVYDRIA
jgi:hypothetical protein